MDLNLYLGAPPSPPRYPASDLSLSSSPQQSHGSDLSPSSSTPLSCTYYISLFGSYVIESSNDPSYTRDRFFAPSVLPSLPELPGASTSGRGANDSQTNRILGRRRYDDESSSRRVLFDSIRHPISEEEGDIDAAPMEEETSSKASEAEISGRKTPREEGVAASNSTRRSLYFNCNICSKLGKDPVVTPCGHLFCWSCIYRWLYFPCQRKECPVCRRNVREANLIPIYGRGASTLRIEDIEDEDSGLRIPPRPHAHRFETTQQSKRRAP